MMMMLRCWLWLLPLMVISVSSQQSPKPHIIYILADDLGFNDVGFHGSAQIPTPNIDALAYSGLILNRYYVAPICTPSRSSLMTGKYAIHTGMQHTVLYGAEPRGLPLEEKLLPQYLNDLGYTSHIAGKWHLGHWKMPYTPLRRGFNSHVGYWTGHHDYNDHTAVEHGFWGLDMRNGSRVAYELHGQYTTDVITQHSIDVIANHPVSKGPLFLYVAHAAAHSGNPYNPLPVADDEVIKLGRIEHYKRRRYAAMVSKLDESVGIIVDQLRRSNMLENSIIVFATDNGGAAEGFNLNFASNYPLRGVKNTLWEGGVRGVGLLWSQRYLKRPRVAEQTMHITDWLPTFVEVAGGKEALANFTTSLDGQSIWQALVQDEASPRKSVLHNIDDIWNSSALTVGDWKLIKGTNYKGAWDGWYGPAGERDPQLYNWQQVAKSLAGKAMLQLKVLPSRADQQRLRSAATVNCPNQQSNTQKGSVCNPLQTPCLFNLRDDPCEQYNLATQYPLVLNSLLSELKHFNSTAIPPSNLPDDPRGNPKFWNYTWTNFGDYPKINNHNVLGDISMLMEQSVKTVYIKSS
ncbi:arylsulfatase B [Drosophila willistoni]|uniref:arylsulfatase B n=1 Tax=Drosophila willistoni TaxID=7260 RepID=UPI000C26D97E|nr:arylsulfatase B [Drosophila willistoni]XP_023030807.1 arylsulfatase B [Drosophila willistoni]